MQITRFLEDCETAPSTVCGKQKKFINRKVRLPLIYKDDVA